MKKYKRLNIIFNFVKIIISPILKLKFNYHCESLKDISGPFIIVCNHNTDLDPFFISLSLNKFTHFVATEKILRLGFISRIIKLLFDPIIHYKGKMGIFTVKEMLRLIKDGENVGIFPEGNRSFNGETGCFNDSIGKVIKKSGAKLITYQLKGGYFTQPRWGTTFRRGLITGKLVNIYEPTVLSVLNENDINEIIKKDLYVNAYQDQMNSKIAYRGKNLALGLESTIFACPKCKRINTLKTNKNSIYCSCGYNECFDEFGYVGNKTILDLDKMQIEILKNLSLSNDILFGDFITVEEIDKNHKVIDLFDSTISAKKDRIYIGNNEFLFSDIGMAIHGRNTIIIHTETKHFEIKGALGFSALKYLYLYEKI